MFDPREIKRRITVPDYARNVLGYNVNKPGQRWYSLGGGTNKSCLELREYSFSDYKLGLYGDVIDLCAIARHNGDKGAAFRELAELTGVEDVRGCEKWQAKNNALYAQILKWHDALRPCDREYLHSRRITDAYADSLKIGFDGHRLVVPSWKNGRPVYYITRDLGEGGPKYMKAKLNGYNENIIWGLHTLSRNAPLVTAEGVFDAMSFDQERYRVISALSGHFNADAESLAIDICRDAGQVFVCHDWDSSGVNFTLEFCKKLLSAGVKFTCNGLDTAKYKDVSEYYCAGGSLQELVDSAIPGIIMLGQHTTNREEFEALVRKAGRIYSKAEMREFEQAMTHFPKVWVQGVVKAATTAPSDAQIASEITEAHELLYSDALGFYEYEGGVWRAKSDTEIKSYINSALGRNTSGTHVNSILTVLKSECVGATDFDRAPVFNFRNGTLELGTGNFRAARAEDMCTTQATYNYDKAACAPMWDEFIRTVCCGDEDKMLLLAEIAGYVLYEDCSLQKCFFLLGDGANGKSVFLDTLSEVFGEANVSNVPMSGLVEQFQRIRLLTSLLNLSSEVQSDVKGAEAIFKQAVVGEKINGCYKGKDYIEFRPRAKFICACNDYIRTRDLSRGFLRRICFVKFDAHFVDDPKSGEYKADRDIARKLGAELAGIFNWAYEGYKRLKANGRFTETADQREIMNDFMGTIDPVIAFVDDFFSEGENCGVYTRKELYGKYKVWCEENGHKCASSQFFIRRVKSALSQKGIPFYENKGHSRRVIVVGRTQE